MDLTIRNGTVATATETTRCDIGISGEKIVAIAERLPAGRRDIDAKGRYVLPGGIDSHCHIEQLSGMGIMCADDFYCGTVSAAFGGTTTIIPFAAQHRGTLGHDDRRRLSRARAQQGGHRLRLPPDHRQPDRARSLKEELPAAISGGITSFKVYMTYDRSAAGRRSDARGAGSVARARGRAGDGARREPRHDPLASPSA